MNLPKYKAGTDTLIVYTIGETVTYTGYTPDKTEPVADGETITNEQEATEVTVKKVWDDDEDRDGIRPDSLTVVLSNGTEVVLNEENDWTATVDHLPKIDSATGDEIEYTWTEKDLPDGYTLTNTEKEGAITTLTNTHVPELTELPVKKIWDDADNQDDVRAKEIKVHLLADGVPVEDVEPLVLNEENHWTGSFKDLLKYRDQGVEIVYTVEEEAVDQYTAEYEVTADGITITNTHIPGKIDIPVEKEWLDDNNDEDGKRPESITVNLYADGEKIQTVTIKPDANGNWAYTFKGLDKNKDGKEIKYTIEEEKVMLYYAAIEGSAAEGFKIRNRYINGKKIIIEGQKTWVDDNNFEGHRPSSITIRLFADGVEVRSVAVTAADGWHYLFADLPQYNDDETEIVYTIDEDDVYAYQKEIHGFDVTNIHVEQTGDNAHPGLWITILSLSVLAGVAMLILERKSRKQRNN